MKNTTRKQFQAMFIGFLLVFYAGIPAVADDTEIFTGLSTSTASVRPNVMFILDTSESMNQIDGGETLTRLDRMKNALYSILDSMTNVNVGLMRFSGDSSGGPVLFPVSYIDENVCNIENCGTTKPSIAVRVSSSSDDAEEDNSSGSVDLTSTTLDMVSNGTCSGSLATVTGVVDTAEDTGTASMMSTSTSGNDLHLMYDTSMGSNVAAVGVRFPGVNIPKSAYITCATIAFTVSQPGYGNLKLKIYGDADANADSWDCSTKHGSCSMGPSSQSMTSASADWDLTSYNPAVGLELDTSELKTIVQEIVNTGGWNPGNDMGFIIEDPAGTSHHDDYRTVYSANGATAPVLKVYYDTSVSTSANQTVGIRFQDVEIPQGATITSASLEFVANDSSITTTNLNIAGELSTDSTTFSSTSYDISGRTTTTSSVAWSVPTWGAAGDKESSPDISSVVQEVVNQGGWCGGNSMSFIITGSGQRSATSYDGTPGNAPLLRVTYDASGIPSGSGCMKATVNKTIAASTDDAEERISDSSVTTGSNDIDLVDDGGDQAIGLRFQNVDIAQGATVLSAKLQFQIRDAGVGSVDLNVWGEGVDNASAYYASPGNITSRTKTSASVAWTSVADPAVGNKLDSPDLTTVVQEIVNRAGWASGNDMGFIIERASGTGTRTTESYDGLSSAAARLIVQLQWNSGGGTTIQTVRTKLKSLIQDLDYKQGTPTVDTLDEAAHYFRGEGVNYGKVRGLNASTTARSEYTRVSHPASYTGGSVVRNASCTDADLNATACKDEHIDGTPTYISPIGDVCQTNHIVLLTDGNPTSNSSASDIKSMIGKSSCTEAGSQECGTDLVKYLFENDQTSAYSGMQNIITYTIGFNYDDAWLQSLASSGGGSYYNASNATDLVNVFNSILASITTTTSSFVAPGAAVNQFNRLRHNQDIYFSLFKPDAQPLWQGNLKKYTVNPTSLEIEDATSAAAVDKITGFFKDGAESYWSPSPDGNDVDKGGAASQRSLTRNTYTDVPLLSSTPPTTTTPYATPIDLSLSQYALSESNVNITTSSLGLGATETTKHDNILKWARGVDVKDFDEDGDTTEVRLQYADPLHSRPVIVTYGGTVSSPDNVVYFATNEGFLYAIDPSNGHEIFNFIPQELLPNLKTLYDNSSASAHPYGLDGNITVYHEDNGTPYDFSDDHIYLYVGMRRGGQIYYGLDVTDRNHPKLLWQINGGTTTGYTELAQTWSAPVVTKVNVGGTVTTVLVFGGGYDPDQDSYATRTADSQGRAIFMADALTGARVWMGSSAAGANQSFSDMIYSIPGNVRVIDTNKDGLADLMYAADMGGQVWRFDIDNGRNVSSLVSGFVLADLSASSDAANTRRFYNTPDVAKIKDGTSYFYSVAIGSGWRAHPLNTAVTDRFYMIRDTNFNTPPASWTKLTESDLDDATGNNPASYTGGKGWYITLENTGEKVLSDSVTLNNQIVFSTYTPTVSTSGCSAAQGTGRTYAVKVIDATPTVNLDSSTPGLTKEDRLVELKRGGIPPKPTVLMLPDPVVLIGPETPLKDMSFGDLSQKTFWYQIDKY